MITERYSNDRSNLIVRSTLNVFKVFSILNNPISYIFPVKPPAFTPSCNYACYISDHNSKTEVMTIIESNMFILSRK